MLPNPLARRLGQVAPPRTNRFSAVRVSVVRQKLDPLLLELPQHLDLMSARLQNGENIYSVFARQSMATGLVAAGLKRVALRLSLGESIDAALSLFSTESGSPLVDELANKLILGVRRGTPVAAQVRLLAESNRAQLRVAQLRAAGRNELKMLVPLVFLILPVTIAFAVFPSLQLLQLGL